jgi:hypothetical protein
LVPVPFFDMVPVSFLVSPYKKAMSTCLVLGMPLKVQ